MTERSMTPPFSNESLAGVSGIPVDFAAVASTPEQHMRVKGQESGDTIDIRVDQNKIELVDLNDDEFVFIATLDDEPDIEDQEKIPNIMSFDIRTVKWDGDKRVRHPDFRAKELADHAISYFEQNHGPVNGIRFHWEGRRVSKDKAIKPPSDNYSQYYASKEQIFSDLINSGHDPLEAETEAKKQAALSTWTAAALSIPRGFTRIRDLEEINNELTGEDSVIGEFVREEIKE